MYQIILDLWNAHWLTVGFWFIFSGVMVLGRWGHTPIGSNPIGNFLTFISAGIVFLFFGLVLIARTTVVAIQASGSLVAAIGPEIAWGIIVSATTAIILIMSLKRFEHH